MLNRFSRLLAPFAFLYGLGVNIRNALFDWGVWKQQRFDVPVVCVGNLAVGGTGKTPHVEYLVRLLGEKYRVAVVSRGYRRRTKGFLLATSCHCSSSIFDSSFSAQKPGTKLFIFSSSVLAGYGCPDVRYLVSASGLDTGVMSTVESSVSALFENAEQPSNIGVWASRDIISSGVYGSVFKEIRDRHTDKHSEAYLPWAGAAEIVCLSPCHSILP